MPTSVEDRQKLRTEFQSVLDFGQAQVKSLIEKYDKLITEGAWPIERWGQPEDVGRAVAAIALSDFPFSTGEVINVDGGFHLRKL